MPCCVRHVCYIYKDNNQKPSSYFYQSNSKIYNSKHVLPKKGIEAVSPLATIEGPPIYTIARLSMKEECGANATTGASDLLD